MGRLKEYPNWFGKRCGHFNGVWEEDEITGGPFYQEYEPELVFCSHPKNSKGVEGNCNKNQCPLKRKS